MLNCEEEKDADDCDGDGWMGIDGDWEEGTIMKIAKDDIEVKMEIPGAILRQRTDFGDATGLGKISGEYFSLSAGVDTTPLFMGLEGDMCQTTSSNYSNFFKPFEPFKLFKLLHPLPTAAQPQ